LIDREGWMERIEIDGLIDVDGRIEIDKDMDRWITIDG